MNAAGEHLIQPARVEAQLLGINQAPAAAHRETTPISTPQEKESVVVDWIVTNPEWKEITVVLAGAWFANVPVKIELYDAFIRKVKSWEILAYPSKTLREGVIHLDIAHLPEGLYILRVRQNDEVATRRIMIER